MNVKYQFLHTIQFNNSLKLMEEKFAESQQAQKIFLFGLEHPKVYTSGLKTEKSHILDKKIPIINVRRGGSITLHNKGQLIFYTVLPFQSIQNSLEKYVRFLEGCIIRLLKNYSISGSRIPSKSGVFTSKGKIAFIGLGVKKQCVYHGLAININNNLEDYQSIESCGLTIPITNFIEELGSIKFQNLNNNSLENISLEFSKIFIEEFKKNF